MAIIEIIVMKKSIFPIFCLELVLTLTFYLGVHIPYCWINYVFVNEQKRSIENV